MNEKFGAKQPENPNSRLQHLEGIVIRLQERLLERDDQIIRLQERVAKLEIVAQGKPADEWKSLTKAAKYVGLHRDTLRGRLRAAEAGDKSRGLLKGRHYRWQGNRWEIHIGREINKWR